MRFCDCSALVVLAILILSQSLPPRPLIAGVYARRQEFRNFLVKCTTQTASDFLKIFENIDRLLNFTNANPITVDIPTNAGNPAPIGSKFYITSTQAAVSITASPGVTLRKYSAYQATSRGANSVIELIKTGTNEYILFGDLALV